MDIDKVYTINAKSKMLKKNINSKHIDAFLEQNYLLFTLKMMMRCNNNRTSKI
jgi:hypothetical protein